MARSINTVGTKDRTLTYEEVLNLPVTVDLVTAGRAFGIGRTTAHDLARSEEFPCKVLRLRGSYRVLRADLLRALGIDAPGLAVIAPSDSAGAA